MENLEILGTLVTSPTLYQIPTKKKNKNLSDLIIILQIFELLYLCYKNLVKMLKIHTNTRHHIKILVLQSYNTQSNNICILETVSKQTRKNLESKKFLWIYL